MTPRRKGKPNDLKEVLHDRRATDLLRNAKVAPVEVDDPYEDGGKIIAMRSIREDPLADMFARGHLEVYEFQAARHWESAYENSEIGGVGAIDPSREAVDGGRLREVLTDRQRNAMQALRDARNILGESGNWLIIQVLASKKTLEMVANEQHWGKPGEAQYKYVRRRFHECLSTLAILFGYAMPTNS